MPKQKLTFEYNSTKKQWYADTEQGLFVTPTKDVKQWKQIPGTDDRPVFVPVNDTFEMEVGDELEIINGATTKQSLKLKVV